MNQGAFIAISSEISGINDLTNGFLTDACRNYVITGDTRFRDRYFNILQTRDGEKPWDGLIQHPWFRGRKETLSELYDKVGFTGEELRKFRESHEHSVELVWDEIEAMNFFEGRVDTGVARSRFDSGVKTEFIEFSKKIEDLTVDEGKSILEKINESIDSDLGKIDRLSIENLKKVSVNRLYSYEYIRLNENVSKLSLQARESVLRREVNKNLWLRFFSVVSIIAVLVSLRDCSPKFF